MGDEQVMVGLLLALKMLTRDHTLVRKSDVTQGNGGNWETNSAGTDTENSEPLEQNDWSNIGFFGDPPGCTDPLAENYNLDV